METGTDCMGRYRGEAISLPSHFAYRLFALLIFEHEGISPLLPIQICRGSIVLFNNNRNRVFALDRGLKPDRKYVCLAMGDRLAVQNNDRSRRQMRMQLHNRFRDLACNLTGSDPVSEKAPIFRHVPGTQRNSNTGACELIRAPDAA